MVGMIGRYGGNIPEQTKKQDAEEYEENSSFEIPILFSIQILCECF